MVERGAAPFAPSADFDADGVLCLRVDFPSDFRSASVEIDVAVTAGFAPFIEGLRPRPSALAVIDRCSE